MAMNYAWQERKKFAIPVITGGVVLLIWYAVILGGINRAADDDIAKRKNLEGTLRLRMQAGVPTDDGVGRADRDKGVFEKDLKEIQSKLVFKVDEGFKPKEGQTAASRFGSQRQAVFNKIGLASAPKGVEPPDPAGKLGFPTSVNDLPEPVLGEWLIRLAVVQRICLFSLDCGVTEIKLLEVVPSDQQDEPTLAADCFVGTLAVKFKVKGSADTIIKLMQGLQQEGPNYLTLEEGEIKSSDPTKNLLEAVLTAGALVVRPEGNLAVEAKP